MKKKGNKTLWIVIGAVAGALVLLGFGGSFDSLFGKGNADPHKSTRDIALSCTLDMYTQFHIHPHLTIIMNNINQTIPAEVGDTLACLHPLHTHDGTGTIHVESPVKRDFTLSDFFAVWGRAFSKNQILDAKSDATHEIVMTVNGIVNTEYENLLLRDKDEIVITYKEIQK